MGSASQAVLQATQSSKMIQWVKFLWATTTMVALAQSQGAPFDSPVQYHIQTDQGPERFFRFQTTSGQYRKEQRHLDGSVTGTYGWVDPNGVLRLFDYISDKDGYRIDQKRLYKVGKPINNVVKIPTLGEEDIELGFEVLPLDDGEINVVEVNNEVKRSAQIPVVSIQQSPGNTQIAQTGFPASTAPLANPPLISRLTSTVNIANPIARQSGATFFHGAPLLPRPIVPHPIVPILPPVPRTIVIEEPAPPEPETFVIGSTGSSLPDLPEPKRKFVIGAAANGAEVRRPLPERKSAVGAAAVTRQAPVASSRSTTVIGAASNSGSGRSLPPAPAKKREFSGIVIGLRHNDRRKRLVMPFDF